jgi:hypothetical protein
VTTFQPLLKELLMRLSPGSPVVRLDEVQTRTAPGRRDFRAASRERPARQSEFAEICGGETAPTAFLSNPETEKRPPSDFRTV